MPGNSIPEAAVRGRDHRYLRAMVPALLTQSPGRGRADGRARAIRGPHNDLALDADVCRGAAPVERPGQAPRTWHMDETLVRISGRWMYLFRAVDTSGQTVDF